MGLDSSLSIASGGLANINAQFALLSQNVANAATPSYAVETSAPEAITADGTGMGVKTGLATIQVNQALQTSLVQQNASVSGLQTTQTALQAIDPVLGTPGGGTDLGSMLGNLQDAFSTLLTNPGDATQQSAVVSAASNLAQTINTLSDAYTQQRQTADTNLGAAVKTLNSALSTIGQLSDQIIMLQSNGQSTADLLNQRNAAIQTLSSLMNVTTVTQPNGDLSIFSSSGLSLPTHSTRPPFSFTTGNAEPGSYYPGGGLSGVMLNGVDVTSQVSGGSIGADLTLRDTTMPTDQAELDEFASGLSNGFASQGLTLFSNPDGSIPSGGGSPVQAGYLGYAATIQVAPNITATPSLVRDGTGDGTGGFTPNPSGGPAGFTTLINAVLNNTFGTQAQSGLTFNTTGLGATGTLAAPFSAPQSLAGFATDIVSSQSQQSASVTSDLTTEQAVQTSLTAKVTATSGVNMDTEMALMMNLQNAYGANAKVIAAVLAMYQQLMTTIT